MHPEAQALQLGEPRSICHLPTHEQWVFSCSQLLLSINACILEADNGLNESLWTAWGPELRRHSLLPPVLGAWAVGWSRTVLGSQKKCPISGHYSRACDNKKAKPTRIEADGCLISRATLGSVTDLMFVDHPGLCETLPCASCLPR